MTVLIHSGVLQIPARIDHGRWIVDCYICNGAVGPNFLKHYGTPAFDCPTCGVRIEAVWPSEEMRQGIERLLAMRPHQENWNWRPPETLIDLMEENVTHGVGAAAALAELPEGGLLMHLTDDQILVDRMPLATAQPREIGQPR